MSSPRSQLHLNLFLAPLGHHEAAWRHPGSEPRRLTEFALYQEIVRKAEAAKLDSIFLADRVAASPESLRHGAVGGLEPLTLLSALSVVTSRIGLIGTVSTSFNEPFNLARRLASLDHLSGGRAGWNIITSGTDGEARNFGLHEIPGHAVRYERAREFLEVAVKLWDSWEDDAVLADQAAGLFADTSKVHPVRHEGTYFRVDGPLNLQRSPQGRPLLVQAGSSEDGRSFAAEYAEAIFTAQQTLADAQAFYTDVKARAARFGRDPQTVKILPGICPVIGATEEEAREKEARLHELSNPQHSLLQLSNRLGIDLTGYPLDAPFPELPEPEAVRGHQSRARLIAELARSEGLTLRGLLERLAGGRGHRTFTGTPVQVADQLEAWFRGGAADGFNVMPQLTHEGLPDFLDKVVPELQRRGLFRTEYSGSTLREHYRLPRPASLYAAKPAPSLPG
ncbi:FMN-dependent oxidoreductase (nitrilotriacetate monooxygenase family) [Paenibacillus mucilaginosus]|uniref:LLM class flavin-dependent oxidoreductase n=1 Tax=Paenibacillus mucilaginosus TaxID=61624 RepID=UPI003D20907F